MMTMELLLTEQNSERADKNAEIQRLKVRSPPATPAATRVPLHDAISV
jgi:hypothetical protein